LDELVSVVYGELRRLAQYHLKGERNQHSLQATALTHEAFLRLFGCQRVSWKNRAHFFSMASRIIRRVLVDHARSRRRLKRGGSAPRVSLDEALVVSPGPGQDLVSLDEALQALAELDARKAQVVELRFFGGLSVEETAETLKVAPRTVRRDWSLAKAWLLRELESDGQRCGRMR